jgi:Flp pilus assembly protein TadB
VDRPEREGGVVTAVPWLAAAAGALCGMGIALAVGGALRTQPRPHHTGARRVRLPEAGWPRWRWPAAVAATLIGWVATGWPVAGLIAAVIVLGLPPLLGTAREAARAIERVEAMEEWTRRLGDILAVGVGLEQAIVTSVRTAPAPIADEVAGLAARLSARVPTETALRLLADDLDDPTADLVVAALLLGHRRRGPGVARTLAAAADAVADDVASRRRIEADRAKPRTTARAITVIVLAMCGVGLLNRAYVEPYGTPIGQLVLLLVAGGFVGALWWMRSLTLRPAAARLVTRGGAG